MPNTRTVEIYITRENIESILSDASVKQIVIKGEIDFNSSGGSNWNIQASGYADNKVLGGGKPTCPQPCP